MGFKAWIRALAGIGSVIIAYTVFTPVIDIFYNLLVAMGGNAASTAEMLHFIVYQVFPVLVCLAFLLYAFLSSALGWEDESRTR